MTEEFETPEVTPVSDPEPEPEPEPVVPVKRTSWFRRTEPTLSSPETRTRRIVRSALLYLGLLVVGLALGALAVYMWLYQPVVEQNLVAQGDLTTTQAALDETQENLSSAEQTVERLETENADLRESLETANTRISLLRVMYQAKTAQMALQNREQTPARRAVQEARRELDGAMPAVEAEGAEVAQSLTLRLDLASNEMARDPTTARADLEILINNLMLLERLLAER